MTIGTGGKWDPVWFHGFCNANEIERIVNPQNASDFLLRKRADIVADNTRYERVYLHKAGLSKEWSFEKAFVDTHYKSVLNGFKKEDRVRCDEITYGDMFSDDVNGYAWKDEKWGTIVSLNESLQFYMKFSNLALFEFKEEVPMHVRVNAMRIALRVMLKQEAMDFFMDPRGIIPAAIAVDMLTPIKYELQYIAGHEFAHFLCGHLEEKNICKKKMLTIADKEYYEPIYNVEQKQEFEADIESLLRPEYNEGEYSRLLESALIWFISLRLSEKAQGIINPGMNFGRKTHPSAEQRYNYILENVKIPKDFNMKKIDKIYENANVMCEVIGEDFAYNYDVYDFYGSCYLDKPNTKWRGRQLIDRVDY